jgi:hypothetical protein
MPFAQRGFACPRRVDAILGRPSLQGRREKRLRGRASHDAHRLIRSGASIAGSRARASCDAGRPRRSCAAASSDARRRKPSICRASDDAWWIGQVGRLASCDARWMGKVGRLASHDARRPCRSSRLASSDARQKQCFIRRGNRLTRAASCDARAVHATNGWSQGVRRPCLADSRAGW